MTLHMTLPLTLHMTLLSTVIWHVSRQRLIGAGNQRTDRTGAVVMETTCFWKLLLRFRLDRPPTST
jgi:hypothetical protein